LVFTVSLLDVQHKGIV